MRSRRSCSGRSFWVWLLLPAAGCMKPIVARYVYQDHDFGVVAIPMNTYLGKVSFRDEAEELMARHFPDGYEIVRAEEVNEGERTLDVGRKTQIETEPNVTALNQMIKLGKLDQTTSFEQKDKIMVRECRIIYKRRSAAVRRFRPSQFAADVVSQPAVLHRPQRDGAAPERRDDRQERGDDGQERRGRKENRSRGPEGRGNDSHDLADGRPAGLGCRARLRP